MTCKLCSEKMKTNNSDKKIECAFREGKFNSQNNNCETLFKLREIAYKRNSIVTTQGENLGAVFLSNNDISGYVVVSWYKERGRTENAIIMVDDGRVFYLTEELAIEAIEYNS